MNVKQAIVYSKVLIVTGSQYNTNRLNVVYSSALIRRGFTCHNLLHSLFIYIGMYIEGIMQKTAMTVCTIG